MRYRVEYLVGAGDEDRVCLVIDVNGDLDAAGWRARLGGARTRRVHGASGFQVRDMLDGGRIVALEMFDNPLASFSADARHQIVH